MINKRTFVTGMLGLVIAMVSCTTGILAVVITHT